MSNETPPNPVDAPPSQARQPLSRDGGPAAARAGVPAAAGPTNRSNPLTAPAAALVAGIVAARYVEFGVGELLAAIAALAAIAVFAGLAGAPRRARRPAYLLALAAAGALAGTTRRPEPAPQLDAGSREVVIAAGCVVEPPAFSDGREQFVLALEPGANVRVSLYGDQLPPLRYGQNVELEARIRSTHNYGNPGAFDYVRYLARQNIYWTASGRAGSVRVLKGQCGSRLESALYALRSAVLDRIDRLYAGRRWESAMMKGLLVGQRAEIERTWIEDFRRTGTYHALVISGLHVTVVIGIFLFLLRLASCPAWLSLILTPAAAWLYALLCGGSAPVARAAAACTLFAVGRFFFRKTRLLNLLAAVAIAFLIADPEQLFDASFQLSFLSVAVLGALAVPLIERTSQPYARALRHITEVELDLHLAPREAHFRVELRLLAETLRLLSRIPARVWLFAMQAVLRAAIYAFDLAAVSAVMQFGLALPMALYFHRVSITGVTANVIIVPLTSLVVPLGFGAVLTGWQWLANAAAALLGAARAAAAWHAQWESAWRVPDPPLWLAAALAAALVLFAAWRKPPLLAAAAALLALMVWHPFAPRVAAHELELTAIDVGQGESLFLALPDGKLMLVDAGGIAAYGRSRKPALDIGEDVVSPYLWSRSIRRLDAVAVTHNHEDHTGGLPAIIANFRPRELWTPGRLKTGQKFTYGGAGFDVLAAPEGEAKENNDSLVLRVTYGNTSFLLTGDIGRQVERALAGGEAPLRADVLKVAHHGSRTSTTPEFLARVHPEVALISAGFENQFGNPHRDVIERLEEAGARVMRTDLWGYITVRSDGRRLWLDSWRWHTRPYIGR